MTREDLADVLEEIALLLELKGENPFKIRAYRQGAEIVSGYDGDIAALARENRLDGIKGLGEALRDKLHELASTGRLEFHQNLRAEFPALADSIKLCTPDEQDKRHGQAVAAASLPALRK